MKKKLHHLPVLAIVLASLLLTLMVPGARAAGAESCSLELTFAPHDLPAEGVTFRIYRVGRVNTDSATFTPIAPYGDYGVLGLRADWLDRAATLESYILRDKLPATAQAATNENGVVRFEGLQPGLYLILGERILREGVYYTPVSCFLSLPNSYDRGETWVSEVSARMKVSETPDTSGEKLQRHVLKVWDDAGHEAQRPQKVTVDLLRDGEVYDTVELSAGNNWRYDWTELDGSSQWRLTERELEGYTPLVTQTGITFVVTNTYRQVTPPSTPDEGDEDPDPTSTPTPAPTSTGTVPTPGPGDGGTTPTPPPSSSPSAPPPAEEDLDEEDIPLTDLIPDPKEDDSSIPDEEEEIPDSDIPLTGLPQTGQLWWPVPLLAILGLCLILCGLIRRRRGEAWDELR